MGLFTREDAERLEGETARLEHETRQAYLDNLIDVWDMNRILRNCDSIRESIPRKLAGTRLILQDRDNMMKSMSFAFVIPRLKGWLMRRGSRKWKPTTEAAVQRLQNSGVTVIWYKASRSEDRPGKSPVEPELEFEPLVWTAVTESEAKGLSKQGYMIRWVGEGETRSFECAISQDDCFKIRNAAAIASPLGQVECQVGLASPRQALKVVG